MKSKQLLITRYVPFLLGFLVLFGLYLTKFYSYLLFHSLAEVFSVIIAGSVFALAWNARKLLDNDYLLFIGIAYLFVGGVDLLHTLAYKDMGVFPTFGTNLPTQLWIAARYVQSLSLLIAPLFLHRKLKLQFVVLAFSAISAFLLFTIFYSDIFPTCHVEGVGLTPFKKISEYVISLILGVAAIMLFQRRSAFDSGVLRWLIWSILLTIGAELVFTFYVSVYGFSNLVGHYFKIFAFYLVYKAIIETGLTRPYALLFRNLQQAKREADRARSVAEDANQAKSDFLAKMSHELRTPLNGILGYAQILQRAPSATPQQQHGLSVIAQSGKHLLTLINDILDLAKVEAGKAELYESDFHLPAFLWGMGEVIRVRAEHKGLSFRLELPAPPSVPPRGGEVGGGLPATVRGDERRLRQVLLNLLGNAIKFTNEGSVTLKVEALESPIPNTQSPALRAGASDPIPNLRFTIQDTGVGITPDDIKIIFDPFQQVGDVKNRPAGTGLGLSISRSLVDLMGGTLRVASPPLSPLPIGGACPEIVEGGRGGAGSVFWFDLALPVVDPGAGEAVPARGQIIGVKGQAPRILVVDDNQDNQDVLAAWLSPLGFKIIKASSGREGLDKATELRPDAVIVDLFMPEMDGLEMMRRLHRFYASQDAPDARPAIIATSASVHERDQQKSLAAGGDAFLPKPIDFDLLFTQLQSLLALEWLYQQAPAASEPEPGDVVLPPGEVLRALLDSTMMGDVTRFREQLADLCQADERFEPFAAQLHQLSQQFKFNAIRAVLQEHLEI